MTSSSLSSRHPLPRETRLLLLQPPAGALPETVPAWAAQQRAQASAPGETAVCVITPQHTPGASLHWLETLHARGWIRRSPPANRPVDPNALHTAWQQASDLGCVGADAVLLAFLHQDGRLPELSWGEAPVFATPRVNDASSANDKNGTSGAQRLDLYAIADDTQRLLQALEAGVRTVQVRIKRPPQPDAAWAARLREELTRGIHAARAVGAQCFVNDHWALAAELGADAVHLGQEDLMAMGETGRQQLLASGVALGISSHSVWELCRARALAPRYIACGPVWPTTTKDMPWVPQGLDNLAWWCAHAGAPVVAIGGILTPAQVRQAAACGADGVCLVRALGDAPAQVLPAFAAALAAGRQDGLAARSEALGTAPGMAPGTVPLWPHPSLPRG